MKSRVPVCLVFTMATLLYGADAWAQHDEEGSGVVKAPTSKPNGVAAGEATTEATSSVTFGPLGLTVQVDQTYCGSGGVQCPVPGLIPANTNRNPVRVIIQVLQGFTPVNGLTDAQINVSNSFVPAGGTAIGQFACPGCFQPVGNGTYGIFINPFGLANWKSGSYHVQVQVSVGVQLYRALAQIEIPF